MAQYVLTFVIPDNELAANLAAIQRIEPPLQNEAPLVYLKRLTKEHFIELIVAGKRQLANDAALAAQTGQNIDVT